MVIAIDGPSGVGKSTVARGLATALDLAYLDTGAYYRAVTIAVLAAGVDPADATAAAKAAEVADLDFREGRIFLDGRDVSQEVRSLEVTGAVSAVAAIPDLRRIVVASQRDWVAARGGRAVVEGRDIGTVVFPDAAIKVFLTADAEVRAARRSGDAETSGRSVAEIQQDLRLRDGADSSRPASPLKPADDAVILDTTEATAEEVVGRILAMMQ